MRTRLAIISALALGVLMSSTGTLLAFTSGSGSGNAASAVYVQGGTPPPNAPNNPSNPTTPNNPTPPGPSVLGDEPAQGGKNPNTLPSTNPGVTRVEPTALKASEQKAAGATETLPLTGLAAIPIVVVGLLLIAFGLFLRRREAANHPAV